MNDQEIEREIQAKGLTAPRVTPASIEGRIVEEHYFSAADGLREGECGESITMSKAFGQVTLCAMLLDNGHRVLGVNAGPVDPANFDGDLARKLARANAIDQIWPLEGYLLREKLAKQERVFASDEAEGA